MKICQACGRTIEPRKKWAKNFDEVKYCSERCRRSKNKLKNDYGERILQLLDERGAGKTICPSELLPENEKQNKAKMEAVRVAARHLVSEGKIQIWQNGKRVDPSTVKGPIRLKLVKS